MRYGKTVLLRWPLSQHIITAGWKYTDGTAHNALDFRAAVGTPVYAAEDGTVETAYHWNGKVTSGDTNSYGNMVKIRHADYINGKGKYVNLHTLYAHLDSICVKAGQTVKEGEIIGYSGNTGHSFGAHLHFEVRLNNVRMHPLSWMDSDFACASEAVKQNLGSFQSVAVAEKEPSMVGYLVDLSKYQGKISDAQWREISAKCVGVILRLGYRGYGSGQMKLDPMFAEYIGKCKEHNIPVGVYFFTQAVNVTEAEEEADLCLQYVSPWELKYPCFIDTETADSGNGRADRLTAATRTECIKAFCERAKHNGFNAGVYASTSWFASNLNDSQLVDYDHWVADYRGYNGYTGNTAIWQYSSKNALGIDGFGEKLDCNKVYKEYYQSEKQTLYTVTCYNASVGDRDKVVDLLKSLGLEYDIKGD